MGSRRLCRWISSGAYIFGRSKSRPAGGIRGPITVHLFIDIIVHKDPFYFYIIRGPPTPPTPPNLAIAVTMVQEGQEDIKK